MSRVLLLILAAATLVGCGQAGGDVDLQARREVYVDARTTLLQAADSPNPAARAHAIEALARTLGPQAGSVYLQALEDPSAVVRFAAAMAVGDTRYAPAKDKLLQMAADKENEPDRRVFAGVIYALYRLGNDEYAGELARLLFDPEKEVRAMAAMGMGRMGEPSAVGPLETLYSDERDPAVRVQVVESLAMLGEERYQTLLEAYTKTQFMDERLVAISALQRVQHPRARDVLSDMLSERQPPRVRVAAAGGLARLGTVTHETYRLALRAARRPRSLLTGEITETQEVEEVNVFSLQRLAAIALGWMDRPDAVPALRDLLEHTDSGVRVAAAMSLLRLLPEDVDGMPPAGLSGESVPPDVQASPVERPRLHTAGARESPAGR